MNSFGRIFRISIFGESHGESVWDRCGRLPRWYAINC